MANPFVQTFSFGSPSDVDLDKLETYSGPSPRIHGRQLRGKLQDLLV